MIQRVLLAVVLAGGWSGPFVRTASAAATAGTDPAAAAPGPAAVPDESLQAGPVESTPPAVIGTGAPIPPLLATPTSTPVPAGNSGTAGVPYDFGQPHLLLPYYVCAYTPAPDQSELNLGLFLSQTPGIDVALGWGAVERVMVSARVSAVGASSLVGLGMKFLALPEEPTSTKPAVSLWMQGLSLNDRQLGDIPVNIFRGNRLQVGALLSKDLGRLAAALSAGPAWQRLLDALRLHAGAIVEYQTGREGAAEDAVSRAAFGARVALEVTIQPELWYAYGVLDTLPDWVNEENYYLGVRYYTRPDLAFDALGGRLQNTTGVLVGIAWVF